MAKRGSLGAIILLLLTMSFLHLPVINASPDADNIPELRIDGPTVVKNAVVLTQTVQLDDDIPGNQVGGVLFTLTIPQICKDDPADTDPSDGKMRGITVTIDPAWNEIALFNVAVPSGTNDHQISVIAAAPNNLDTTNGRNVATIQCVVSIAGPTTVSETFSNIQVSKFTNIPGQPQPLQVQGEAKTIGPNHPPVADPQNVATNLNTPKIITLTASDEDGDSLTLKIVAVPSHGLLGPIGTKTCNGTVPNTCSAPVTYTPNSGFTGSDSFNFTANDGALDSNVAKVSISVGLKGDLNGDGKTTVADLIIKADCLSGRIVCTPEQEVAGDVFPPRDPTQGRQTCGDGIDDLNDLLALIDIALGRTTITQVCG